MTLLEMRGVTKRFPPNIVANDEVDFTVEEGEVHGLLGENGAGKTTLMNVLYGIHQPDRGTVYLDGREAKIKSPSDAIRSGVGMVHQHFMLIPSETVAENISLTMKETKFFLPLGDVRQKIHEYVERFRFELDPDAKIWQLSAGEQQKVEILKIMMRNTKIIILDEPTSVLTRLETRELFEFLEVTAKQGNGVIFVSHKLGEVVGVCDKVTVMRKGRVVATLPVSQTNERELVKMMVGEDIEIGVRSEAKKSEELLLDIHNLVVESDRGTVAVDGVSVSIRKGEIFGVAAVAGNGQKELVEAIIGLRRCRQGTINFLGKQINDLSVRKRTLLGMAYIPEERVVRGIAPNLTVAENLMLTRYYNHSFLDLSLVKKNAERMIEEFNIVASSADARAKLLSGGNIQKLILAREISKQPRLLIAEYPTAGLDVAATNFIRNKLVELKERDVSVLLVSENLEELLQIADRIVVLYKGRVMDTTEARNTSLEDLGMMMAGLAK